MRQSSAYSVVEVAHQLRRTLALQLVQRAHVAAGAERTLAAAAQQHRADRRVVRPGVELAGERAHGGEIERVEHGGTIQGEYADAVDEVDQDVGGRRGLGEQHVYADTPAARARARCSLR